MLFATSVLKMTFINEKVESSTLGCGFTNDQKNALKIVKLPKDCINIHRIASY